MVYKKIENNSAIKNIATKTSSFIKAHVCSHSHSVYLLEDTLMHTHINTYVHNEREKCEKEKENIWVQLPSCSRHSLVCCSVVNLRSIYKDICQHIVIRLVIAFNLSYAPVEGAVFNCIFEKEGEELNVQIVNLQSDILHNLNHNFVQILEPHFTSKHSGE